MNIPADGPAPAPDHAVRRHVLQTALRLAEQAGSWDAVHVHEIAHEAQVSLDELRRHFADKDTIAEAFFDTADLAMVSLAREPGWLHTEMRERLFRVIMAWLDALQAHKGVARAMLGYKLKPEHLHLQARGVMRISRTVQWFRETALMPSRGWRREVEEAALTGIYLTTLAYWLRDTSPGSEDSRRLLRTLLNTSGVGARWLGWHT